jgi:hypothetical protein
VFIGIRRLSWLTTPALPPLLKIVNVGNITCVFVGKRKRTVAVGDGVWVGVFEGVGVLVIVWVGGRNWAVCVRAAAAVSKIMVSTAPGSGETRGIQPLQTVNRQTG